MNQPKRQIFRQEALDRLSSPEQLDQLMQVVSPQSWVGAVVLGGLLTAIASWSIWGRIPITVSGRGVLTQPYRVLELQAPIAGRLQTWTVKAGDSVHTGQLLGILNQSELQTQLQQQQVKLQQLQSQDQQLTTLNQERISTSLQVLRQQRQNLWQQLQNARQFDPLLYQREVTTIAQQRQALQQQLQDLQALEPVLLERWQSRKQLLTEGAIATDSVLAAEQAYRDNRQQALGIQVQLRNLERQATVNQQTYQQNLSQVSDLEAQLKSLDSQETTLSQQTVETSIVRTNQIQDVKRQIAQLQVQLQNSGQIRSPYTGQMLEILAKPGQVVTAGTLLGTVELVEASAKLTGLFYLPIKDGKQLQPGMAVQITPDTVKREQYGGIVGRVKSISAFPVTRQTVINAVGNAEVAQGLLVPGGQIQAIAELEMDPTTMSRYQWSSSRGPNLPLSAGTTASVSVTIAQEPPIYFVLPFLKARN